jgi:hypothetical protein
MVLLDDNNTENNLNILNNNNEIYDSIQLLNKNNKPNNLIPKSSNYISFNKNEYNNEYILARYSNGIINPSQKNGNKNKEFVSNINLNTTINQSTNNNTLAPSVKINYPTTNFTYENFENMNKNYNIFYSYILILLLLFFIIIIYRI